MRANCHIEFFAQNVTELIVERLKGPEMKVWFNTEDLLKIETIVRDVIEQRLDKVLNNLVRNLLSI